jgi:hypothetical protein
MRARLRHTIPLLVAAAGILIGTAPTAFAATGIAPAACTTVDNAATVCGDTSINDSPPVQFGPQYPYWEGNGIFGIGGPGVHGSR